MENYENETTVVNFIVVLVKQNSVNREKNKIGGTPMLKIAMVKRLSKIGQKKSSKKSSKNHQKLSQKNSSKNSSKIRQSNRQKLGKRKLKEAREKQFLSMTTQYLDLPLLEKIRTASFKMSYLR